MMTSTTDFGPNGTRGTPTTTTDGVVIGTAGNDVMLPGYTDATGDKIDGLDAIVAGTYGNDDIIVGGAGNDRIDAGLGNDSVFGGSGNDTLDGGAGNDTLFGDTHLTVTGGFGTGGGTHGSRGSHGGSTGGVTFTYDTTAIGNDILSGGDGNDVGYGGAGNDTLYGGNGNDALYGDAGNDVLAGGAGNNAEYGGDGDDRFVGGAGADTFFGGAGQDNLDYSASGAAVTVNLTTNVLSGGDAGNDNIAQGIDGVIGSNFADSLTGFDMQGTAPSDTFTNQFWGNGGNDTISGLGGNDLIYGGADQDQISGGAGDDSLAGDAGNDSVDGGDGNDTVTGGTGDDRIVGGAGVDNLSGGDDRDLFVGGNDGDQVDGGAGGVDNDTLDLTGLGRLRVVDLVTDSDGNGQDGKVEFLDADGNVTGSMDFKNIENVIPCFTPGTLIATPRGEVRVEDLRVGDRIITRDSGMQEIRWLGRRDLSWKDLTAAPHLKPILIRQGALGNGLPERDMMVSPNHRVLVANDRTALYFDEHEVLVAAKHLAAGKGVHSVDAAGASYIHFMFDRHEVVLSNGAWTESFQPGDLTLKGMGNAQRSEIFDLFPELKTDAGVENYGAARRTLKRHEAMLITK